MKRATPLAPGARACAASTNLFVGTFAKTISIGIFLLASLLGISYCAMAHTYLDHASPASGSVVATTPGQVQLWFTGPLEPAFSTLRVLDQKGQQVDRKDKHVEAPDAKSMGVSLPALAPGQYRVVWRAVSVDTHVTEGDFIFTVQQ